MKAIINHFLFGVVTLFVLAFSSCKNTPLASQTIVENIQFGSGGGFTGRVTAYSLMQNGELKFSNTENDSVLKKIDSLTVQRIFEKAKILSGYEYNRPENMYAFLEINKKYKKKEMQQRIVWGMGSTQVDVRVKQ